MKLLYKFSVCFFLLMSLSLQAQFSIGLKSGYTRAWQNYGENRVLLPEGAKIHVHRMNIALPVYYRLGKHWQIGLEPAYTGRGAACVPEFGLPPEPSFKGDTRFKLDYVEVPLSFRFEQALGGDRLSLFVKAAYGFSYMFSGISEIIDLETGQILYVVNVTRILRRWEHGAYTGLGLSLKLSSSFQCFLTSEYYHGFVNVDPRAPSKARSLSFNLGTVLSL